MLSLLRGPLTRDVVRPAHKRLLTAAAPVTVGRSLPFMGASGEHAPGAGPEAVGKTTGETAAGTADEVVRSAYEAADHARLRALKATYDPHSLFRHNHNIRPA